MGGGCSKPPEKVFVDRVVKESAQSAEEHLQELQECKGDLTVCTEQLSDCQKKCAECTPSGEPCKCETCKPCKCEPCKPCKCETCKECKCEPCPTFEDYSTWELRKYYIVGGVIVFVLVLIAGTSIVYAYKLKKKNTKLTSKVIRIQELYSRELTFKEEEKLEIMTALEKIDRKYEEYGERIDNEMRAGTYNYEKGALEAPDSPIPSDILFPFKEKLETIQENE